MIKKLPVLFLTLIMGAVAVFAQDDAQIRSLVNGQKYKIKGVVVAKDDDSTFIVRDTTGVDTKVVITPNASIKNNAFFGGDKYPATSIVRGLNLEVEGRGDGTGALSATKVRFDKSNLQVAQSIDARVSPFDPARTERTTYFRPDR